MSTSVPRQSPKKSCAMRATACRINYRLQQSAWNSQLQLASQGLPLETVRSMRIELLLGFIGVRGVQDISTSYWCVMCPEQLECFEFTYLTNVAAELSQRGPSLVPTPPNGFRLFPVTGHHVTNHLRRVMDNVDLHPPDDYSHRFFIWHEWIQVGFA
jgi:hypothetical protein